MSTLKVSSHATEEPGNRSCRPQDVAVQGSVGEAERGHLDKWHIDAEIIYIEGIEIGAHISNMRKVIK